LLINSFSVDDKEGGQEIENGERESPNPGADKGAVEGKVIIGIIVTDLPKRYPLNGKHISIFRVPFCRLDSADNR
jgi:hypothetical protein